MKNCIDTLNQLGTKTIVTIKWVKAHNDHVGNEYADYEAKLGTCNVHNLVHIAPPLSWAKGKISQFYQKSWDERWTNLNEARQTKIWWPCTNRMRSKRIFMLNRQDLGLSVQMIAGHNFLRRHEGLINPGADKSCRFCEEEEETSWHLIGECPSFWRKRWESFGAVDLEFPPVWKIHQFQSFLRKVKMTEINQVG